nr:helix-turn-helix domain-containing protein [Lactobacillus bombicola]
MYKKRLVYKEVIKMLNQEVPISQITIKVGISRMQAYHIKKLFD